MTTAKVPGVEARAGKFPGPSLIPALTAIQDRLGWLPREELEELARETRRPRYEIEGLVSFYPHFRTSPPAPVALHVCHDLPCFLRGGVVGVQAGELVVERKVQHVTPPSRGASTRTCRVSAFR